MCGPPCRRKGTSATQGRRSLHLMSRSQPPFQGFQLRGWGVLFNLVCLLVEVVVSGLRLCPCWGHDRIQGRADLLI